MTATGGASLVGRDDELRAIQSGMDALRAGRGGGLAFVGEPGIGKSRMLVAAAGIAEAARIRTLTGRTRQPVVDTQPRRTSSMSEPVPWPHLLDAARRTVAGSPVAVVVDDAHQLHEEHLAVIEELIELTMVAPLLLLLAYRPRQLPPVTAAIMGSASVSNRLSIQRLRPLPRELAHLVVPDHHDPDSIHQRAGGNPLYMQVLADPSAEPAGVLHGELARLSPTQRAVAQYAAALGDPFTIELLTAVSTLDASTTMSALDCLVTADIIRPTEPAPLLAFRHPVVARTVYKGIEVSRRRAIHLRVEQELTARGASVVQRAPHVMRAADPTRTDHFATLINAAHETVDTDPNSAATWLKTACTLVNDRDPRWLSAQLLLARANLLAGRPADSREVLLGLSTAMLRASPGEVATAATYSGQAERLLGRYDEADAVAREGLAAASDPPSTITAVLLTELAEIAVEKTDYLTADRYASAAAGIARRRSDRADEASALGEAAVARVYSGNLVGATAATTVAARLVDAIPDSVAVRNLTSLYRVGRSELCLERLIDAERHLTRGVTLARRTGQFYILPALLKALGDCQLRRGRIVDAIQSLDEATGMASQRGIVATQAMSEALTSLALLWRNPGDPADVLNAVRRALTVTAGARWGWAFAVRDICAETLIFAGEPVWGSQLLLETAGGAHLAGLALPRRARLSDALVTAALGQADLATATKYQAAVEDMTTQAWTPARRGFAQRVRLRLAAARDDHRSMTSLGEEALHGFRAALMPLEVARTQVTIVHAHLAHGRREDSVSRLNEAMGLATACGAHRLVDEITQLMGRIPSTSADWRAKLTARETEVATLAGSGMSSSEIAAKLHLSVRTVDFHLGRVYRKLGVANRAALATIVLLDAA